MNTNTNTTRQIEDAIHRDNKLKHVVLALKNLSLGAAATTALFVQEDHFTDFATSSVFWGVFAAFLFLELVALVHTEVSRRRFNPYLYALIEKEDREERRQALEDEAR